MSKATLSDVAACFRVLLGREPSLEEIAIHTKAHVGNDLADVLKQYLESQEFKNRNIVQVTSVTPSNNRPSSQSALPASPSDTLKAPFSDRGNGNGNRIPNRFL